MSDPDTPGSDASSESPEVDSSERAAAKAASSAPYRSAAPSDPDQEGVSLTRVRAAAFSGPLPPPEILQAYERIQPGFADRIVTMAEKQSDHRRSLESRVVGGNVDAQKRGQLCALGLGLAGAALAGLLIWKDQFLWGGGLFVFEVLSLAGLFLAGRKRAVQELKKKQEQEGEHPGDEEQLQLEMPEE